MLKTENVNKAEDGSLSQNEPFNALESATSAYIT